MKEKKTTHKICGEKATNIHTDWNFECALKYIYTHIRKKEQKTTNYMRQHKYLLNSSY